jgi:hypothetical protein
MGPRAGTPVAVCRGQAIHEQRPSPPIKHRAGAILHRPRGPMRVPFGMTNTRMREPAVSPFGKKRHDQTNFSFALGAFGAATFGCFPVFLHECA